MSKSCRICREAGRPDSELTSKAETYLYRESGLPNVVLVGVLVRRCPTCGHHEFVLPRVTELHRTITDAICASQAIMNGAEVRLSWTQDGWRLGDAAA
ncbi:MAG: hypothetical protein IT376_16550 [Polyangiaceae bacterium]|nr:hypothetical protein [Polyangiaceae bacterium]